MESDSEPGCFVKPSALVIKGVIFLLLSVMSIHAVPQVVEIGIFMTVKYDKNCEHRLVSSDDKKFCLAPQPVITADDFAYITELENDVDNIPYFSIAFTEQGVKKLKNLATAFPNNQLAMVVDNEIIGFIKNLDVLRNNKLRISGEGHVKLTLAVIHEKLSKVLSVKKS